MALIALFVASWLQGYVLMFKRPVRADCVRFIDVYKQKKGRFKRPYCISLSLLMLLFDKVIIHRHGEKIINPFSINEIAKAIILIITANRRVLRIAPVPIVKVVHYQSFV